MPFVPLIVPAKPETQFEDVRFTAISFSQSQPGGPVTIQVQCQRCTRDPKDASKTIDAPPGTDKGQFGFSVQYGIQAIYGTPDMLNLLQLLYKIGLAEAVKQGHLQVTP